MNKIASLMLAIIMFWGFSTTALAFTESTSNPYTGKTYTHDDKHADAEIICGIDVSYYQGTVDFEKVKADGIDFVFLRAAVRGYGSKGTLMKDSKFPEYFSAAKSAGLDIGAYIYSQAITVAEAKQEADYILDIVKGYNITLPIVFDFEYASPADSRLRAANLSNSAQTKICLAFCERVESAGYTAMVYANQSMLTDRLNDDTIAKEYDIWLANYSTTPKYASKLYDCDYTYWQYNSQGRVAGISGDVDCDFRYYTAPDRVTGLTITNEEYEGISLEWEKVKGCYGYQIYKYNSYTEKYVRIGSTKGASITTFIDTESKGHPSIYKVRAITAYKGSFKAGSCSKTVTSKGVFKINVNGSGTGYCTFNWQVYPGADEYQILRSNAENGTYSTIATVSAETTHFTDFTDDGFKTYYYIVKAVLRDENGELLANYYTPTQKVAKEQPKIGSATLKTSNSIQVAWTNVKGATGTEIWRKPSGGAYKKIKTITNVTTKTYTDKSLKKGVKYYYAVRHYITVNGIKYYSSYSSSKSAITLKTPSVALKSANKASKITYEKIYGASGYEIYMKASGGKYKLIKTTSKTSYTKKSLSSKKTYYFKVRAYKTVNGKKVYSSFSKAKKIKTK